MRDKPRVFRNPDRQWTVRRPGFGFGAATEQAYPSWKHAIRSTERLGGHGFGQTETAWWPSDGDAATPGWQAGERL